MAVSISREKDEHGFRWYVLDDTRVMSVTTILKFLDEDTRGLEIWKGRNDGTGDNPYHQHLYWYSARRGTLCHYQALCLLVEEKEELWGEGESLAMHEVLEGPQDEELLKEWEREGVPTDTRSIAYSVLANQGVVSSREEFDILFPDMELIDVLKKDVDFFVDKFKDVCDLLGVNDESVVVVEKFLLNGSDGYGGQTDLVYIDPDGEVVVADLKTSSSLRQKHRLQAVAYSKAVELDEDIPVEGVDRVEVIRVQPDKQHWQVHSHTVPERMEEEPRYTDAHWFKDKWGKFEYESLEEMWEKFKSLAEKAHAQGK